MQAFYFPIDPRLNFFVANKLLKELAVSKQDAALMEWLIYSFHPFFSSLAA